ncbi:hypothetical protein [Vulcanisaeta distributa]|nr:hypothetical protein [Vulcanisaeta distributa]
MRRSLLIAIVAMISLVIALILIPPHGHPTRVSSPPPEVSTVNSTATPY